MFNIFIIHKSLGSSLFLEFLNSDVFEIQQPARCWEGGNIEVKIPNNFSGSGLLTVTVLASISVKMNSPPSKSSFIYRSALYGKENPFKWQYSPRQLHGKILKTSDEWTSLNGKVPLTLALQTLEINLKDSLGYTLDAYWFHLHKVLISFQTHFTL